MKLLLSPHFDDAALFACFTCLREQPWVVVCFDGAKRHGSFEVRSAEEAKAMRILGCDSIILRATPDTLAGKLALYDPEHVWAPWPEPGGNSDHNLVGTLASSLWPDRTSFYTTYTDEGRTVRGERVLPESGWKAKKRLALACYRSQYALPGMRVHFQRGMAEYLIEPEYAEAN